MSPAKPRTFVQYELKPYKHPCHVQGCTEKPAPYIPILEVIARTTGDVLAEYQMSQYVCDKCRRLLLKHIILTPEVLRWVCNRFQTDFGLNIGYEDLRLRYETVVGIRPIDTLVVIPSIGRKLE